MEFNNTFTSQRQSVDISRFEKGNVILPGTYRVDIFVNDNRLAIDDVTFRAEDGSAQARPCFTSALLQQMGVDIAKLDPTIVTPQNTCIDIQQVSDEASARMDLSALRLDVSIPQASLTHAARGYVSSNLWEQGETAFLLGYSFNAYALQQTHDVAHASYGQAMGLDGTYVPVQNGTYYALAPNGTYVPSTSGNYALSPNGSYQAVRNGTYQPPGGGSRESTDVNAFLGLDLGLNVGGWRIRSQETAMWDQHTGTTQWHNIGTTANHDITAWKAQFTAGDGYTQGILFDTTPYRGISVYTDDRMLPDSQTGYAPVVRGVANTQARVEVRQGGNVLYETTVAPGPFVISDLYATGYGGDLTVTIHEADGSAHAFSVPYSAVPMLLRPGVDRWALTSGQVHETLLASSQPYFFEGTYQRGLNNWLTAYAGAQVTTGDLYKALLGGVAVNSPIGAVSLDITHSHANLPGSAPQWGDSVRLSYSKAIPSTNTTFALATFRYSNRGFLSLSDAVAARDMSTDHTGGTPDVSAWIHAKQRLQVVLNQNLGARYGSLYFTGSYNTYWNTQPNATTYQLGYNNGFRGISFGITASRTYSSSNLFAGRRYDNQFGLNLSIPLGKAFGHSSMLTASAMHDDTTGHSDRIGINGNFGADNQYDYNANASYADTGGSSTTASGSMGWQSAYGSFNAGYSWASRFQQTSISAAGGMVVHHGGMTLTPQLDLNSAIGIVEAPNAAGARISSSGQARVNDSGYAVATGLIPYRMNDVTLDPLGMSADVELQTTRLQTAPRAGAVVPLPVNTTSGRVVLIHALDPHGEPLPFGAQVIDATGKEVGSVAQSSRLMVRVKDDSGQLTVRWGDANEQQCRVSYRLPPSDNRSKNTFATRLDASCR